MADNANIKPGIYAAMTAATYFADPCPQPSLTQSIAKILIEQSPAHARLAHPRLNPDWRPEIGEYKAAFAIGNAAHKTMIGRGKDVNIVTIHKREKVGNKTVVSESEFMDASDFKTDEAQNVRDQLITDGKTPILAKHMKAAKALCAAIRAQLALAQCADAFTWGYGEVVLIAQDHENGGIWLRSMVDWMCSKRMLYDLKTGGVSAAPHAIPYRLADQGWDIQAAMQGRILDILDPENAGRRSFRFVPVENEEPFGLTVNELTEGVMTLGRKRLQYAIDLWRRCMGRGEWPLYPPLVHRPEYPGWAEAQWLNREISEAARGRMPGEFDPQVVMAG